MTVSDPTSPEDAGGSSEFMASRRIFMKGIRFMWSRKLFRCSISLFIVVLVPLARIAEAQVNAPAAPPDASPSAQAATDKPPLKQEELEQLLAPIALYPDSLLSQIFMSSTYPLEIVSADR